MGLATLFFILAALCPVFAQHGGKYDCPVPWLQYEDKCYKFQMYPDTLDGARAACKLDGATLLSINNRREHEFIADWLANHDIEGQEWFTSGRHDKGDPKTYWRGDGSEIQGSQFWLSEKARSTGGTIVSYGTDGVKWGWLFTEDDQKQPYICEISRANIYRILQEERGFGYGVAETDSARFERGPRLKVQPKDIIFDKKGVYKYALIECFAEAWPSATYEWYKLEQGARVPIDPQLATKYTMMTGRLFIHAPQDAVDDGNYQCVARNKFGAVLSNIAQLTFGYLGEFPKSRRDAVHANAYKGIGIECSPPENGYPVILYAWYKDSPSNFVRPKIKPYIFVSQDGKLYFSSVTKVDAGNYFCWVTSPRTAQSFGGGKVSMAIGLVVSETIASEHEPEIVNGFPKVFPSSPKRGDDIRVECFAWGTGDETGKLDYSWVKDGERSLPAQSYRSDHDRVLNIPNMKTSDFGTYRCTVHRRHGGSSSSTVTIPFTAAPYFTIPLLDQIVDEGATVTWQCYSGGQSTNYKWYRNSLPLSDSADGTGHVLASRNVLSISGVTTADDGMYQCGAENSHGIRFSSAQLRVLSFAPKFNKYPLQPNQYATLAGNLTLICQPEAAPRATTAWTRDGRPVGTAGEPTARVRLLANGNLRLVDVRASDAGLYACSASNALGEATSSGNLTVLASSTISQFPRATTIQVNSTAFFHCEASFNPLLDLTYDWYQNDIKVIFFRMKTMADLTYIVEDEHFKRGEGIYRGGLYIKNAQFYHAGRYRCVAKTTTDEISRSAILKVFGPPSPPVGIVGKGATSTTIDLSWIEGGSNGMKIISFIIDVFNVDKGYWEEFKTNIRERRSVTLTGLSPWSQYSFRIRAVNELGVGLPCDNSTLYMTHAAKPLTVPRNVGGGGGKVGVLTISWDPLPRAEQNGPDVGYIVSWKKKYFEDEQWDFIRLYGADHRRHVTRIGSQNFYLPYEVKVQAFNLKGKGPELAQPVAIFSSEDLPIGVPMEVRATSFNMSAIRVEWQAVPDKREAIKGILLGYRVNYWKEFEEETTALFTTIRGAVDKCLIIGLNPQTYYYINVQVFNTAGYGPKSSYFIEETLRSAPMYAPTEVSVSTVDYESIYVKWRGVSTEQNEEPLEGYKVAYWKQGETIYVATYIDSMKKTRRLVTGLETNTLYNLRVVGYSRGGDGLFSSPTIQFILGDHCQTHEESPEKEYVYECRAGSNMLRASYPILLVVTLIAHLFCRHV